MLSLKELIIESKILSPTLDQAIKHCYKKNATSREFSELAELIDHFGFTIPNLETACDILEKLEIYNPNIDEVKKLFASLGSPEKIEEALRDARVIEDHSYKIAEAFRELQKETPDIEKITKLLNCEEKDLAHSLLTNISIVSSCTDSKKKNTIVMTRGEIFYNFFKKDDNRHYISLKHNVRERNLLHQAFGLYKFLPTSLIDLLMEMAKNENMFNYEHSITVKSLSSSSSSLSPSLPFSEVSKTIQRNLLTLFISEKAYGHDDINSADANQKQTKHIKKILGTLLDNGVELRVTDMLISDLRNERAITSGITELLCRQMIAQGSVDLTIRVIKALAGDISESTSSSSNSSGRSTPTKHNTTNAAADKLDWIIDIIDIAIASAKGKLFDVNGDSLFSVLLSMNCNVKKKFEKEWSHIQSADNIAQMDVEVFSHSEGASRNILFNLVILQNANLLTSILNRIQDRNMALNIRNTENFTPLHTAALNGRSKTIIKLVATKENINDDMNDLNYSPLMCAAKYGFVMTINDLVELGANVNQENIKGETAMLLAIEQSNEAAVAKLLALGANPNHITTVMSGDNNQLTQTEQTPLNLAITKKNKTAMSSLIYFGTDIDANSIKYENFYNNCDINVRTKLDCARQASRYTLQQYKDSNKLQIYASEIIPNYQKHLYDLDIALEKYEHNSQKTQAIVAFKSLILDDFETGGKQKISRCEAYWRPLMEYLECHDNIRQSFIEKIKANKFEDILKISPTNTQSPANTSSPQPIQTNNK